VPRAPAIAFDNNAILVEKAKSEGVFFSREIRSGDRALARNAHVEKRNRTRREKNEKREW
jgi:hypothetical protein